jgi:hypothetical protein
MRHLQQYVQDKGARGSLARYPRGPDQPENQAKPDGENVDFVDGHT